MIDLMEPLNAIDPATCDYNGWVQVGMALKHEGYSVDAWDAWSAREHGRYHHGECYRKWESFREDAVAVVTGGTIYQMAIERGWRPSAGGRALDWDDVITRDDEVIVDQEWIEDCDIEEPDDESWHPAREVIRYLEALFEPNENVGYVVQSYKNDKDRYVPQNRGSWDRTAGQLIEELSKCGDDIGAVLGDYDKEGGAWIRFNPLDGNGIRNSNVSEFRYALVESDNIDIGRQYAIIKELDLPCAVLVFSGGKSLHAIVRVEAPDQNEYKKRVEYLYKICEKNGMQVDTQNKNPSRLSRMPGVTRGGHKQFIVAAGIGKKNWAEWRDWIENVNDDLPDVEELRSVWNDIPELAPCLIDGVLRKGHKMLIAGPSKAGKSFLQIELCIAIAEGKRWLNWQCAQGRVLYVNLELDRASCLHRFKDVYDAMGLRAANLKNIDIWNLRGKAAPMDKLAPKIVSRAQKKDYTAVIIDPIYKVLTGDENSADQMAKFCNQFDLLCTSLGCAVIYCHHHSKGTQGGKKSMDRASGSGVFARDPDTMLDMIELPVSDVLLKQEENKAACAICIEYLSNHYENWRDDLSQDDLLSAHVLTEYCRNVLGEDVTDRLDDDLEAAKGRVRGRTAWRIDGTLREFPKFPPVNVWFDYPAHTGDESGVLADIKVEDDKPNWMKGAEKRKEKAEDKRVIKQGEFEIAFEGNKDESGKVSITDMAKAMNVGKKYLAAWFGDGDKARDEYKEMFEIFTDRDGQRYIERKKTEGATLCD